MRLLVMAMALQPQLGASDVARVVDAVLEYAFPADGSIDGEPIEGRPIHLDTAETNASFRDAVVPELRWDLAELRSERPIVPGRRSDVIRCLSGEPRVRSPRCSIPGGGFYMSILEAEQADEPGEYLLVVRVNWVSESGAMIIGYDMEMFVGRVLPTEPGGREEWKVLRPGSAIVSQRPRAGRFERNLVSG